MYNLTLTKEQALEMIGKSGDIRPTRIIQGLLNIGYKNVSKVGRGKNILFLCEKNDDEKEDFYYLFKDICIKEYHYPNNFDYDKALDIIWYHKNNSTYSSIGDIAKDLGLNEKTLYKHRNKLKGKILKETEICNKKAYAKESDTDNVSDITDIYNSAIMSAYNSVLKNIEFRFPKGKYYEVALFKNKKTKSFEIIQREKETFEMIKESLNQNGNKYIASYPVWFNNLSDPYMNKYLKQRVFQLILNEYGYDYVFFLRLYEISEDLKDDKDLLEVIEKAIEFKEQNK